MKDLISRLLDRAVQIQQIAAPTFEEKRRADFVRESFLQEGLKDVAMDSLNNVYARFPGLEPSKPLIVSAHLDTVFPSDTSLHATREEDRIYGPGIGDNSLGVAALFGLIWMVRERRIQLPSDVWFVANVCEEGLGDLRGMRAVVDRFGGGPSTSSGQAVKAYLVIEGLSLGHIYHLAVGVRRYRVTAKTAGGHSWSDYGQPSAVHEAARLVTQIASLSVPVLPRTTLNIGKISGGTGVNVLASEATFELDLRSESLEGLNALIAQTEELIRSAEKEGVQIEFEVIGSRPAGEIAPDHPLIRLAEQCLREQGLKVELTSGSTDANIPLSRGIPATVLGVTRGGGAHTVHEYIEVGTVEKGMEQLAGFVEKVWER
ncbi:MAG TPA: M20/M25/M40 family metallo-hydrolase [Anaerolineales bacterium]|nr:M20/M25/M40 family metallo-hydrolase [Anaerolineales bacterium]